ncbi:hypothetical protein EJ04DRAFT_580997 [Polyplosphaeria fusca]|uniref:F-box domain-containing protein n=1 Tax=Polyplosphaeria fusca TaxID=682080 RepID=A0A9P4UW61_9PLEO|nr:hypothetical protein EJ04DRAFT_580997 [Polyplosphaeria fusca]
MAEPNPPHTKLTTLPAELLVQVYQALPSLFDAAKLRATCHILHSVIECYAYARKLLAKGRQRVPLEKTELADKELARVFRNAARIEGFIGDIERDLIPRLEVSDIPRAKRNMIYAGTSTHPPTLTPTERLRVIRASYQIWIIMQNDDDTVRREVFHFRPRQLWYFAELTDWARIARFPGKNHWETFQISKASSAALFILYSSQWNCRRPRAWKEVFSEKRRGLYLVWDHCQDGLRGLICRRAVIDPRGGGEGEERGELWDYEEGDELFVGSVDGEV